MRKYLQTIAANTAGTPTHKILYDAAGIGRHAATSYDDLLDTLMITQRVPAWAGNRTDRAVRLPKRYLIDPGLLTALLRIDQRRILRDGDRQVDRLAALTRAGSVPSTPGGEDFMVPSIRVGD
jgi:predicted AAA+ superfamily ATPase